MRERKIVEINFGLSKITESKDKLFGVVMRVNFPDPTGIQNTLTKLAYCSWSELQLGGGNFTFNCRSPKSNATLVCPFNVNNDNCNKFDPTRPVRLTLPSQMWLVLDELPLAYPISILGNILRINLFDNLNDNPKAITRIREALSGCLTTPGSTFYLIKNNQGVYLCTKESNSSKPLWDLLLAANNRQIFHRTAVSGVWHTKNHPITKPTQSKY